MPYKYTSTLHTPTGHRGWLTALRGARGHSTVRGRLPVRAETWSDATHACHETRGHPGAPDPPVARRLLRREKRAHGADLVLPRARLRGAGPREPDARMWRERDVPGDAAQPVRGDDLAGLDAHRRARSERPRSERLGSAFAGRES